MSHDFDQMFARIMRKREAKELKAADVAAAVLPPKLAHEYERMTLKEKHGALLKKKRFYRSDSVRPRT